MKLYGVTFTYNESAMIKYVMPYIENLGYDKLIVYDNCSTDDTVEQLSKYPFIEVKKFDTDGVFNEDAMSGKMRESIEDFASNANFDEQIWVTCSDFDEVLFYTDDKVSFKDYLEILGYNGYNLFNRQKIEVLSESFPYIKEGEFVHTKIKYGRLWGEILGRKLSLFMLNDINYMEFHRGNHSTGVKMAREPKDFNKSTHIFAFHLKYLDNDYIIKKYNEQHKRLEKISPNRYSDSFQKHLNILNSSKFIIQDFITVQQALNEDAIKIDGSGIRLL